MKKIIDISKWNAIVNFSLISKEVDGVIVRAGFSGNMSGVPSQDSRFFPYMTELNHNKVALGSYYVTAAITEEEAKKEAEYFINLILSTNVTLSLPIYVCTEWTTSTHNGRSDQLSTEERTKIIKAFIDQCEVMGFKCGVMGKTSWFKNKLDMDTLKPYSLWVIKDEGAKFDNEDMIRTSDKFEVKGIAGFVSVNELNGFLNPYIVKEEPKKKKEKFKKKKRTYEVGGFINAKDTEVYKTSISSTVVTTVTGRCYIVSTSIRNGRIKVSDKKNGDPIGWVIV